MCVHVNEETCHPVQQCGSLMCYITVLAQEWSAVEQRQRMYQALNTHTIPVSGKTFIDDFDLGFVDTLPTSSVCPSG